MPGHRTVRLTLRMTSSGRMWLSKLRKATRLRIVAIGTSGAATKTLRVAAGTSSTAHKGDHRRR